LRVRRPFIVTHRGFSGNFTSAHGRYSKGEAFPLRHSKPPIWRRLFVYKYDFGDSWEHEIVVEKILPADQGAQYPSGRGSVENPAGG